MPLVFRGNMWHYQQAKDLKGHNTQHVVVIWVKDFLNELMVEIYSKNLVRAIGKVLLMKFSHNTN